MIRLLEAPSTEPSAPALASRSELHALASVAADLVPTAVADSATTEAEIAAVFAGKSGVLLVRAPAAEGIFVCPVLLGSATREVCLDVAAIAAEACFGMSSSRFMAALPRGATPEAIESVLAGLAATSNAGPLPPFGFERVFYVLRRMFQKTKLERALLSLLPEDGRYASVVSRDPRTGARPALARAGESIRTLLEPPGRSAAPLAELGVLPNAERTRLDEIVVTLETAARRPVRVAFTVADGRAQIVSIEPLRRAGIVAFELARDLLNREVLAPREALALIDPSDVGQAVELCLVIEPDAAIAVGIAAGSGFAEGFVALTPGQAEELCRAGFPAILVVPEVTPEDIGSLRASAGIITVRGGITGEAAVMARGLAKPCVASGAALSLASGEVHIAGGGVIRPYERITIDGRAGAIVRGVAAQKLTETPDAVTALLDVGMSGTRLAVLACVEHPNHVITAKRLGATGVVLLRPERVFFELLSQPLVSAFADVLLDRIQKIAEAARSTELPLCIVLPPKTLALPSPVARLVTEDELAAFSSAVVAAQRVCSELEVVEGPATPGRALPGQTDARCVLISPCPGGAELALLSGLVRQNDLARQIGFACDPGAVLATRLLLGQIDP